MSLISKDVFLGRPLYRLILTGIYESNIALPTLALGTQLSRLRLKICLDLGW